MRLLKTPIRLHITHQKLQVDSMHLSKSQLILHIFTPKVTSWSHASIEDSIQSAHPHSKSYVLIVCAHRRLRSEYRLHIPHQKFKSDHIRLLKTPIRLHILHQKLQVDSMHLSKTQFSLHIFTPKVTSWPNASIEDSVQSAHPAPKATS